jgi:hypothetical protein
MLVGNAGRIVRRQTPLTGKLISYVAIIDFEFVFKSLVVMLLEAINFVISPKFFATASSQLLGLLSTHKEAIKHICFQLQKYLW